MENQDLSTTTSPPLQEEPELKKARMSTTTSDDDETAVHGEEDTTTTRKPRYKRRKIAIFFAYCGVGYQGMQKNPGAKTIEGDLEEAFYQSGAVREHDRGIPKRYDWARSARTDKGVSAVGQVVSGRFYVDPPGFVERLNANLPSQFRIFGYKRVTASFNAKKFCDRRRYVYLIPVFALDPSSHRDRESVLASLGSGSELVKCLDCSERGRKVIGAVGKRSFESKSSVLHTDISSNTGDAIVGTEIKEDVICVCVNGNAELEDEAKVSKNDVADVETQPAMNNLDGDTKPDTIDEAKICKNDCADAETQPARNNVDGDTRPDTIDEFTVLMENATDGNIKSESGFCYGEKEKERFNRILNYYVGSHNFHNFTTRTKAEDPAARRYIVSFEAKTVVTVEGIDFVKCEVVGQSFMLHQIRKMIGVAVAIMRNCAPETLISTALQRDVNINVPTAPEVGLYLDECLFTSYNQKWKDSHEELSMKDYEEAAEDFKMKYIYSHIAATEHKEGTVALWLHSLNYRNYPDLLPSNYGDSNGERSTEAEQAADSLV